MCDLHHPTHQGTVGDLDSPTLANAVSNLLNPLPHDDQVLPDTQRQNKTDLNPATKKTRRKLWELPHKLHCPVIGTCLDTNELRRIARNVGVKQNGAMSDYDVHVSFVSAADDKNPLSLAAHKALEKKYAAHVRRFAKAKDSEQLEALWDDALISGDVPGAFWAGLTHPKCDFDLKARLFEEVHMLSHQIGAGQRADLKRLSSTQRNLAELQQTFDANRKRSHQQIQSKDNRILELERKLRIANEKNQALVASEATLKQTLASVETDHKDARIEALEDELRALNREFKLNRQECEQWKARYTAIRDQRQTRPIEANPMSSASLKEADCNTCRDCPNLAGQRILCVGGRRRLIEQYRDMVTRYNGRFDYHDGGIEDSRQRLDAMLSSADAVVCATDAISHDAYYRLKRFCKRHAKPHAFLKSSGISTFAQALDNVAVTVNTDENLAVVNSR